MFNTNKSEQQFRELYDNEDRLFEGNIINAAGCSKHKAKFIRDYIHNNWVSNSNKSDAYWECIDLMHDILERMNYGLYRNFNFSVDLSIESPFIKFLRDELDVTDEVFSALYNTISWNFTIREVLETVHDFFVAMNTKKVAVAVPVSKLEEKTYSDSYNEFFARTSSVISSELYKHLLQATPLCDYFDNMTDVKWYYQNVFDGFSWDDNDLDHIDLDYCFGDVYRVFKKAFQKGPVTKVVSDANDSLKERNKKIIDLHNSGLSQQKIADKLNMARSTVGDIIRKFKSTASFENSYPCQEIVIGEPKECVIPSTTKNQWVAGHEFITCYLDGAMYTADRNHPNFKKAFDVLVSDNDVEKAVELINIKKTIEKYCDGDITIEGSTIRYKDIVLDTSMTKRIIQNMREGKEFKHLVRFLGNLVLNPRREAVYELFDFLENSDIEITEDGYFIAYKRVRPTYMDIYTNTIDNSVGTQPAMEPFEVDPDRDNECSRGLHVGSWGYMPCYSSCSDDRIIRCKVNPAHVVSVPRSYNAGKLRTWTYKVIDDVTDIFKKS